MIYDSEKDPGTGRVGEYDKLVDEKNNPDRIGICEITYGNENKRERIYTYTKTLFQEIGLVRYCIRG